MTNDDKSTRVNIKNHTDDSNNFLQHQATTIIPSTLFTTTHTNVTAETATAPTTTLSPSQGHRCESERRSNADSKPFQIEESTQNW